MIRSAFIKRHQRESKIYRVVTTDDELLETTSFGNVIRNSEFVNKSDLGRKTKFESLPISIQKKFLNAMDINPLVQAFYLYSPLSFEE